MVDFASGNRQPSKTHEYFITFNRLVHFFFFFFCSCSGYLHAQTSRAQNSPGVAYYYLWKPVLVVRKAVLSVFEFRALISASALFIHRHVSLAPFLAYVGKNLVPCIAYTIQLFLSTKKSWSTFRKGVVPLGCCPIEKWGRVQHCIKELYTLL